ncbi:protein kinase domain-containing protein, partial [Haematococcus lacustris]
PNSGALGPAGSDASGSAGLAGWDSFDQAPLDNNQLLINCMEMSKELQSTISAPDVVAQLKSMVTQMQRELGDQEVVVTRVLGSGGSGVVYQGTWRGLTVAVKTLVFTVLPMQPMTRRQQRAMTEAAICRTLHHPNIVATYAYELQSLQALGSRQPSQ